MNALAQLNTALQLGDDSDFENVAPKYLRSLRFFSKGDDQILAGHYGIKEADKIIDLGDSIDIMVFARKRKAIDFSAPDVVESNDRRSLIYQKIELRAQTYGSKCMEGIAYLLFERSTAEFYELYCCSADLKRLANELNMYMRITPEAAVTLETAPHDFLPATLGSRKQTGKYPRRVPTAAECSLPFELPGDEVIAAEIAKFLAVRDSGVQASESPTTRVR